MNKIDNAHILLKRCESFAFALNSSKYLSAKPDSAFAYNTFENGNDLVSFDRLGPVPQRQRY